MKTLKLLLVFLFLSSQIAHSNPEVGSASTTTTTTGSGASVPIRYFDSNGDVNRASYREFNELYNKFKDNPKLASSKIALQRALAFFAKNKNSLPKKCGGDLEASTSPRGEELDPVNKIKNQNFILLTDYTIPNPSDRFFVLNVKTGEVESCPAAHGYGSNQPIEECPKDLRVKCPKRTVCRIPISPGNGVNEDGKATDKSGQTSRGFFAVDTGYTSNQETFKGGKPASEGVNALNLRGLIGNVNDRALERSVVFHRASYAGNECSSSAGCPAICPELFEKHKEDVQDSLMYLHTLDDEKRSQPDC